MIAIDKAVYKVHSVITVLDENGKDELGFQQFSDPFQSLGNVSIQLFDARGVSLQKYKKSNLAKQVAGSGLVPDGNLYYIRFPVASYPITMLVDYEVRFNGLLNYPDYEVQLPEQSIESSVFIATVPAELDLKFKGKNTSIVPVKTNDGKLNTYSWSVKNLPALIKEAGSC